MVERPQRLSLGRAGSGPALRTTIDPADEIVDLAGYERALTAALAEAPSAAAVVERLRREAGLARGSAGGDIAAYLDTFVPRCVEITRILTRQELRREPALAPAPTGLALDDALVQIEPCFRSPWLKEALRAFAELPWPAPLPWVAGPALVAARESLALLGGLDHVLGATSVPSDVAVLCAYAGASLAADLLERVSARVTRWERARATGAVAGPAAKAITLVGDDEPSPGGHDLAVVCGAEVGAAAPFLRRLSKSMRPGGVAVIVEEGGASSVASDAAIWADTGLLLHDVSRDRSGRLAAIRAAFVVPGAPPVPRQETWIVWASRPRASV
jgi:hypothetical protein